jgi:SNF2 family DNA or RNA helicase
LISPKAVEEFLARKMRDGALAKRFSTRALDAKLAAADFRCTRPPRFAQKVSLLLGWKYSSYLFLLGMGGGKSTIVLELFRRRFAAGQVKRMLVLVPNVVNLDEWVREAAKAAPEHTIQAIDMAGKGARMAAIEDDHVAIVVLTYQGLIQLCSKRVEDVVRKKGSWKLHTPTVDQLARQFDMLVLDESTSIKNDKALPFKAVRRMRKSIEFCYALTGTPFDKDPIDLWAQFYAIDFGWTLGETIGLFRGAFFRAKDNYFGGTEYEFKRSMKKDLAVRIGHCSVRFSEEECQDLPPSVGGIKGDWMLVSVEMPKASRGYYAKMERDAQESMGDYQAIDNAYTRMRMVSSGWLGAKDDQGERVELIFPKNPKLDALVEKLHELGDERAVVVHWFNMSGKLISDRLTKEKISHVCVSGAVSGNQKKDGMRQFREQGGPRVLVASTAISKGVNLQDVARYMLFFESPSSTIDRKQMEARIRREGGLDGTRYYYDFVTRDSVDETILQALRDGRSLHDVIVDRAKTGQRVPQIPRARQAERVE